VKSFEDSSGSLSGETNAGWNIPRAGRQWKGAVAESVPGVPYKKGDLIGDRYEVYGILGTGGFGVVYLVYSRETGSVYALKTFRDEYLQDVAIRQRFRREANVWVDLERHAYIVRAWVVDEIRHRLYIATEYIAPDEWGLNSLEGYLRRRPPDLAQGLRWAIQFCHGMEYAYSKGIRSHRDIKPANILISQGKTVKITDFGLAGVLGTSTGAPRIRLHIRAGRVGLSDQSLDGAGFGSPTHMPPEQFTNAARCDARSDIYAFGVVLYQMATGGELPFLAPLPRDSSQEEMARFWWEMYGLHNGSPVPRLDSIMFPVIRRCLEKEPGKRYATFREVRSDMESLLRRQTGEVITAPELKALDTWEWNNKGFSLHQLGRFEEAIRCYDQALVAKPRDVWTWRAKGDSLERLHRAEEAEGCYGEAVRCCDQALELEPENIAAWVQKGDSLSDLGGHEEAIRCYDRALAIDPENTSARHNKGHTLGLLGRYQEALQCAERILELDPRNVIAWHNKAVWVRKLGGYDEALWCAEKILGLDPRDAQAWVQKGYALSELDHHEEALHCFDQAIMLDPRDAAAWINKVHVEERLGRIRKAADSQREFMALFSEEEQREEYFEYFRKRLRDLEERCNL
jgi:serine/threonine protein kinase/Tfp pilus assembly protein PilF